MHGNTCTSTNVLLIRYEYIQKDIWNILSCFHSPLGAPDILHMCNQTLCSKKFKVTKNVFVHSIIYIVVKCVLVNFSKLIIFSLRLLPLMEIPLCKYGTKLTITFLNIYLLSNLRTFLLIHTFGWVLS